MKLGKDVLLEIMDIVRQGLAEGKDVSQGLRDLDLSWAPTVGGNSDASESILQLSDPYLSERGRERLRIRPSIAS